MAAVLYVAGYDRKTRVAGTLLCFNYYCLLILEFTLTFKLEGLPEDSHTEGAALCVARVAERHVLQARYH